MIVHEKIFSRACWVKRSNKSIVRKSRVRFHKIIKWEFQKKEQRTKKKNRWNFQLFTPETVVCCWMFCLLRFRFFRVFFRPLRAMIFRHEESKQKHNIDKRSRNVDKDEEKTKILVYFLLHNNFTSSLAFFGLSMTWSDECFHLSISCLRKEKYLVNPTRNYPH